MGLVRDIQLNFGHEHSLGKKYAYLLYAYDILLIRKLDTQKNNGRMNLSIVASGYGIRVTVCVFHCNFFCEMKRGSHDSFT